MANPARLGIVSSLYDMYTATHITEALMNVYTLDKGRTNAFQSINSLWMVTNRKSYKEWSTGDKNRGHEF